MRTFIKKKIGVNPNLIDKKPKIKERCLPSGTKIIEPIYSSPTDSEIENKLSNTKNPIPMSELLKELLSNPRVESITIDHNRVGNVEHTKVEAKLKLLQTNQAN
jgi:hypothetical protein